MQLNTHCMQCQIQKQEQKIRQFEDQEKKEIYMKEIIRRYKEAGPKECAPSISARNTKFFSEFWGVPQADFTEAKRSFNTLMLNLEGDLEEKIRSASDPLEAALVHARIGNYIDFSAIPNVSKDTLLSLIEEGSIDTLDEKEYANLRNDLKEASSLLYITDNCGEIVLDKIAVKILKEQYPNLSVTILVRGYPTTNDATMEDAIMCGLTDVAPVMGNGSDVPGTWLSGISDEARTLLEKSDILIAKGQGNYETLHGCGLNIYYLFLCKCDWFVQLFHARPLQGMFVNERRI